MSSNYLIHFGNKNSGRYRRGSGERPNQHDTYSTFQYGESGKMSKRQIKKAAKTAFKDYNKVFKEETNKYTRKHYKTEDASKLSHKQIQKSIDVGADKAEKLLQKKYGVMQYERIVSEANDQQVRKSAAYKVSRIASLVSAAGLGLATIGYVGATLRR